MSLKYELKNGQILREGIAIANRDPSTGAIDYLPDMDRYRAPVTQWLKEIGEDRPPVSPPEVAARQAKVRTAGADDDAVAQEPVTAPAADPDADSKEPAPPVAPEAPAVVSTDSADKARIAQLEAQLAAMKAGPKAASAPMPATLPVNVSPVLGAIPAGFVVPGHGNPPMDENKLKTYRGAPAYGPAGDKTPAFVDWLWENHTDDAARRYSGRKIPGKSYDERLQEARDAGKTNL